MLFGTRNVGQQRTEIGKALRLDEIGREGRKIFIGNGRRFHRNLLFDIGRPTECNFIGGEWDSEVRFVVRDPDGSEMYDSGFAPFEGLDYQQYIYFGDFETCESMANNVTGSDCDDSNPLNYP